MRAALPRGCVQEGKGIEKVYFLYKKAKLVLVNNLIELHLLKKTHDTHALLQKKLGDMPCLLYFQSRAKFLCLPKYLTTYEGGHFMKTPKSCPFLKIILQRWLVLFTKVVKKYPPLKINL